MQAQTERFEMRLDTQTLAKIDQWRAMKGGVSRSEAVRLLIEEGLQGGPGRGELRVDASDRLMFMMLRDILRKLDDEKQESEIDPEFLSDVLVGGHFWALEEKYNGLFHQHRDSPVTVREVSDVLDMWTFVERGFGELKADEKKRVKQEADEQPVFLGFDGNNEGEHYHIARFMVEKMEYFSSFKKRSLNSHCPVLSRYRQMLPVFDRLRPKLVGRELSADELISVLRAQR